LSSISLGLLRRFQAEAGLPCKIHPSGEGCELPVDVDVLDASGPCQPYSALRNSGFATAPEKHPLYKTTFGKTGSVISVCRKTLPRVFISEQVEGFAKESKENPGMSPKTEFVSEVLGITRPDGTAHFTNCLTVKQDAAKFVRTARPRLSGCLFHNSAADPFYGSVDGFHLPYSNWPIRFYSSNLFLTVCL
jgi:hypothetical protein